MRAMHALARRLTASYALIQCVSNMGYCCVMSFASVTLLARGFSNADGGLTLTVANVLAIACQPLVAAFADRTKRVTLATIVSVILGGIALLSLALLLAPPLAIVAGALYVLLYGLQSTQISLVTSLPLDHINSGVPVNFSLARGIGSLAFAVLAFLLGFLVEGYGARVVMLVNCAIGVAGVLLVLAFARAGAGHVRVDMTERAAMSLLEFSRRNRRFMGVVISVALMFFSHSLITTYTIQIVRNVGGGTAEMGVATAIAGLIELPAMALFAVIFRRIPNAGTLIKVSGLALVVKALLTLLAPTVTWIYIAQLLQFLGFALYIPASVYYVNGVIPVADKVKGQAYMGLGLWISAMLGNAAGGVMLDNGGVAWMLTVGVAVSLAGLLALLVIDRRTVLPPTF